MSDPRPLIPGHHNWPATVPGVLPPGVATPAAGPAKSSRLQTSNTSNSTSTSTGTSARPGPASAAATGRPQPPLQEVLKGLDARELEGPSVFDQLFGPLPDADPRLPKA